MTEAREIVSGWRDRLREAGANRKAKPHLTLCAADGATRLDVYKKDGEDTIEIVMYQLPVHPETEYYTLDVDATAFYETLGAYLGMNE